MVRESPKKIIKLFVGLIYKKNNLGRSGTSVQYIGCKKGNIRKYKTFCGGITEDCERKSKNIIKYIC